MSSFTGRLNLGFGTFMEVWSSSSGSSDSSGVVTSFPNRLALDRKTTPNAVWVKSRPPWPSHWVSVSTPMSESTFHWNTQTIFSIWTPIPRASVQMAILVDWLFSPSVEISFALESIALLYVWMIWHSSDLRAFGSFLHSHCVILFTWSQLSTKIKVWGISAGEMMSFGITILRSSNPDWWIRAKNRVKLYHWIDSLMINGLHSWAPFLTSEMPTGVRVADSAIKVCPTTVPSECQPIDSKVEILPSSWCSDIHQMQWQLISF